jgi:hypothetical protein
VGLGGSDRLNRAARGRGVRPRKSAALPESETVKELGMRPSFLAIRGGGRRAAERVITVDRLPAGSFSGP